MNPVGKLETMQDRFPSLSWLTIRWGEPRRNLGKKNNIIPFHSIPYKLIDTIEVDPTNKSSWIRKLKWIRSCFENSCQQAHRLRSSKTTRRPRVHVRSRRISIHESTRGLTCAVGRVPLSFPTRPLVGTGHQHSEGKVKLDNLARKSFLLQKWKHWPSTVTETASRYLEAFYSFFITVYLKGIVLSTVMPYHDSFEALCN